MINHEMYMSNTDLRSPDPSSSAHGFLKVALQVLEQKKLGQQNKNVISVFNF